MKTNNIIVTASSNRFFPWLLNFIGSIQENYPDYENIIVYNLGLNKLFLNELKNINKVQIKEIPKSVNYWKKDFTWKLLMYEDLLKIKKAHIFYIDSGATVMKPLNKIFNKIKENGYFFIDQGKKNNLEKIIPKSYIKKLNIQINNIENKLCIAAGFIGFNTENKIIHNIFYNSSILSKKGYCLLKPKANIYLKRNCDLFRYDQTILSMILFNTIKNPIINKMNIYGGSVKYIEGQFIHSHRRSIKKLPYLNLIKYNDLSKVLKIVIKINRLLIKSYFKIEKILVIISKIVNKIK